MIESIIRGGSLYEAVVEANRVNCFNKNFSYFWSIMAVFPSTLM